MQLELIKYNGNSPIGWLSKTTENLTISDYFSEFRFDGKLHPTVKPPPNWALMHRWLIIIAKKWFRPWLKMVKRFEAFIVDYSNYVVFLQLTLMTIPAMFDDWTFKPYFLA